jgi:hypothetical protein
MGSALFLSRRLFNSAKSPVTGRCTSGHLKDFRQLDIYMKKKVSFLPGNVG